MIRAIAAVLGLAVVGFVAGRIASAPLRAWRAAPPAMGAQVRAVNPIAGWIEERERLRAALHGARAHGDPAVLIDAARALAAHDPVDVEARRLASIPPPSEEQPSPAPSSSERREAAIRERFPRAEVADAMLLHVARGRTLRAAATLRRLGEPALADTLETIEARLRGTSSFLLGGKLEEAHRRLLAARDAERSVLPPDLASAPLSEVASTVAATWSRGAAPAFERGELRHAAAAWRSALEADPSNLEALEGLRRLELLAAQWLDGEPPCAELVELAASLDPASPRHPEASRRAAACGRRGQVGSVISPR